MNDYKEITAKELFENFKLCKDLDFDSVQKYDNCISQGELFQKALSKNYSLYSEAVNTVDSSIVRLKTEKEYKIQIANSDSYKKNEINTIDYAIQLRFLRDKENLKWENLEKLTEVAKDPNFEVKDYNLLNLSFGGIITVIVFFYIMYLIQSLLSGKIFKLKLANQLEVLEQFDLSELIKKEMEIQEKDYTWLDRKIFNKEKSSLSLSFEEKIVLRNMEKHKELIEQAYRKYMTPVDEEMSEIEIGKIQEEIRILIQEYYKKIGININEND